MTSESQPPDLPAESKGQPDQASGETNNPESSEMPDEVQEFLNEDRRKDEELIEYVRAHEFGGYTRRTGYLILTDRRLVYRGEVKGAFGCLTPFLSHDSEPTIVSSPIKNIDTISCKEYTVRVDDTKFTLSTDQLEDLKRALHRLDAVREHVLVSSTDKSDEGTSRQSGGSNDNQNPSTAETPKTKQNKRKIKRDYSATATLAAFLNFTALLSLVVSVISLFYLLSDPGHGPVSAEAIGAIMLLLFGVLNAFLNKLAAESLTMGVNIANDIEDIKELLSDSLDD